MRLSVVMPVRDEAATLPTTLAALRARLDGSAEVLVVDGGSSDGSAAIAGEHGADRVLHAPGGRGGQLRAGVEAAAGDVLLLLHADCRLPSGAFAAVRDAIAAGYDWGAFRVRHVPSPGAGRLRRLLLRIADRRSWRTRLPYGDQAVFATHAALRSIGGVPDRPLMEDLELSRRLRRAGLRMARLPLAVEADARRFEARPLHATLCWWTFPTLYRLGVPPRVLARWYGNVR